MQNSHRVFLEPSRHKDALYWSEMEVATTFFKDVVKTSSRKHPKGVFQQTSSRPLPGDVLKTSTTSSRLLVKAKDPLETIYRFSIYIRLKLLTYYHSIISYTN